MRHDEHDRRSASASWALAGLCLWLVALQAQAGGTQIWDVTPEISRGARPRGSR